MVPRRTLRTTIALALALALAGCGTPTHSQTPTPLAPVPVVTPSPTPDTEALYAEAERVVLAALELERAYLLDADNKQYPPGLTEFFADPYLKASKQEYAIVKALGERTLPEAEMRIRFQHAPEELDHDADVAVRVCRDSTDAPLVDEHGEVTSPGDLSIWVLLFKDFDGQLKLFLATGYGEVEQCPFE